jgi:ParB-like chromosome segregation protein Spo0J
MIRDEYRPLASLIPNPANPNLSSRTPEAIAILAGKISAVGFTNPFLVDAKTGMLVAGHLRRLALFKLQGLGSGAARGSQARLARALPDR